MLGGRGKPAEFTGELVTCGHQLVFNFMGKVGVKARCHGGHGNSTCGPAIRTKERHGGADYIVLIELLGARKALCAGFGKELFQCLGCGRCGICKTLETCAGSQCGALSGR